MAEKEQKNKIAEKSKVTAEDVAASKERELLALERMAEAAEASARSLSGLQAVSEQQAAHVAQLVECQKEFSSRYAAAVSIPKTPQTLPKARLTTFCVEQGPSSRGR